MLMLNQSSSAKVKPSQLWGKGKDDLKKQLEELKSELGQLRVQKIAGGASSKLTRMCVLHTTAQLSVSIPPLDLC